MMVILYICKLYSTEGNGVINAMNNEIKYLQNECDVALYNFGVRLNSNVVKNIFSKDKHASIDKLPKPFNKPDLVVFEEIYKFEYIKLYKYCVKNNIPYVIIPHGSLVKLEQNRKWLKKSIANLFFFNEYISNASAIQFLNEQEMENSVFKYKKAIILPNGLDIIDNSVIHQKFDYYNFVFIGRYSIYTKGLDILLESFYRIKEFCLKNNVKLSLYGVDSTGKEKNKLLDYIQKHNMDQYVSVNGPIFGKEKQEILEKSYSFIQTSRHEAQPMSIIEAMSKGLPCIATFETSFGKYCNDNKCGIGTSLDIKEIANGIKELVSNKEKYKIFKKNAVECSKRDFDLKKITNETFLQYKKITKGDI